MLGFILVGALVYCVLGATYRLYFHPLAKFPGPKLAAISGWYEFYHDIIHRGQFIWKVDQLHRTYGPIIRITPSEIHIQDPSFYDDLYAPSSKRRDKYAQWTILAGAPRSTFATVNHNHHRLRRSALNPFFSKRAVCHAETLIVDKVQRLCQRFQDACVRGTVIRLDTAYMALTMDIITHYAYGESYNHLAEEDFKPEWKETIVEASANGALLRQFPWLLPVLKAIPLRVLRVLEPKGAALIGWQRDVRRQVDAIIENDKAGNKAKGTIFQAILDSDLPVEEKQADRLQDEGQTLVGAGSETTAKALSLITFYLLRDKSILQRLREELVNIPIEMVEGGLLSQLEQLPYLSRSQKEVDNASGSTSHMQNYTSL
ncbi:hypothetical protein MW887_005666 [Aspergillus wentii]|nr:hypothetical protein MW887_005666 [Aspergillus wentii]